MHAHEVDAAGDRFACVIPAVPDGVVIAAGLDGVDEGADELSLAVEYLNPDRRGVLDAVADRGAGIEGVGVVADQGGGGHRHDVVLVGRDLHYEVEGGGLVYVHNHSVDGLIAKSGRRGGDAVGPGRQHQRVGAGVVGGGGHAVGGDSRAGDGSGVRSADHAGDHAGLQDLLEDVGEGGHGDHVAGVDGPDRPAIAAVGQSLPAGIVEVEGGDGGGGQRSPGGLVVFLSLGQAPDLVSGQHAVAGGGVADLIGEGQPGFAAQAAEFHPAGRIGVRDGRSEAEAARAGGSGFHGFRAEADGFLRITRGIEGVADVDVVHEPDIPEAVVVGAVGGVEGQFDLLAAVEAEVDRDGRGIVVPAAGLRGSVPEFGPGVSVVGGDLDGVVVGVGGAEEHVGIEVQISAGRAVEGWCDQPFVLIFIGPPEPGLEVSVGRIGRFSADRDRPKAAPGGKYAAAVGRTGVGDGLGPIRGREGRVFEAFGHFDGVGIGSAPGQIDGVSVG